MASNYEEVRIRVFGWIPCEGTAPCDAGWACVRHAGLWELIESVREDERDQIASEISRPGLVESIEEIRHGKLRVGEGTPWTS